MITRQEAEKILKEKFNINHFYDEQWEVIESLLNGERVLFIEKTGYGKSLCFQFPAVLFKGVTIVFSPLIALMRDQCRKLNALGINAKCINSEQERYLNDRIIEEAKTGKIKILYIAPERQENTEWIEATKDLNLSMVVVDEAHCISVWGHDFRPAFRRIISLVNLLPKGLPVLATTATATKKVQEDIEKQIGGELNVLRGNLMRSNLKLFVIKVKSQDEKMIWLGKNINNLPGSGIIYTGTRIEAETYSNWLDYLNISSASYHAGLDPELRIEIEQGLIDNKWKCITSTNALGMGIDKLDIRFIIHTQIPQSPIHYYQEIGRAGRDGKTAFIILFYAQEDRELPESFIESSRPSSDKYYDFIKVVKEELLSQREIIKKTNLKQNQVRVIKADLVEQKIVREITIGRVKRIEYILGAPNFDDKAYSQIKERKIKSLEKMIEYIDTSQSRMQFLCNYLGDDSSSFEFNNCDNSGYRKRIVEESPEWQEKVKEFQYNYFPEITLENRYSNLANGFAASYYGKTKVGKIIHNCKYERGGDFPDFLLKLVLKAFSVKLRHEEFDLILYVPPTVSGSLLRNFCIKISSRLNIPISHGLQKLRQTKEQKVFENLYLKKDNIKDAFFYNRENEIKDKNILLIDDICDSKETIREIGRYLTGLGANKITPLVIAITIGGDKL